MKKLLFTFLVAMLSTVLYADDYYYKTSDGNFKYHVTTTALDDNGYVDLTGFMKLDQSLALDIYKAMEASGNYQMNNFYFNQDGDSIVFISYRSDLTGDEKYQIKKLHKDDLSKNCYYTCGVSYTKRTTQSLSDIKYTISSVGELGGMTRMSSVIEATAISLYNNALQEIATKNPDAKFYYNYDGTKYSYMGTDGVTHTTNDAALEGGRYICDIELTSGNTVKVGAVTYNIGIAGNNNRLPGICELMDIKAVSTNGGQYKIDELDKSVLNDYVYATIGTNAEGLPDTTYCTYNGGTTTDKNSLVGMKYLCGYTIENTVNYKDLGKTPVNIHYKKYGQWESGEAYFYNKQQKVYTLKRATIGFNSYNDNNTTYSDEKTVYGAGNFEDALHNDAVKKMLPNLVYKDFPESQSKDDEGNITKSWSITYKDPTNKREDGIYTLSDDVRKFDDVPKAIRDYCQENMKNDEEESLSTKLVNKIRNAFDFITKADVDSIFKMDCLVDQYYNERAILAYYADTCSFSMAPTIFANSITGMDTMVSTALGFTDNIAELGTGTPISLLESAIASLAEIKAALESSTTELTEDELSIISAVSASRISVSHKFPSVHNVTIPKAEAALYFVSPAASLAGHIADLVSFISTSTAALTASAASLGGQAGIGFAVAGIVAKSAIHAINLALDIKWFVQAGIGVSKVYKVAAWLNYQCQNSEEAHAYLADALQTCRGALSASTSGTSCGSAYNDLVFRWERAKALNDLAPVKFDMTKTISECNEILNNMETLTNTDSPHYAKGNFRLAIDWAQNEKEQIREYDIKYAGTILDNNEYNANSEYYPANRMKMAIKILNQAKNIFTRQYAIEEVCQLATDSINSTTFLWADPKTRLRLAKSEANKNLSAINNININDNSQAMLDKLGTKMTKANEIWNTINTKRNEAMNRYKQMDDTLAYVTNLHNNMKFYTTDTIMSKHLLKDYVAFAKKIADIAKVDSALQAIVDTTRYVANTLDENFTYLCFVIKEADKFYEKNQLDMTDYQLQIFHDARATAQAVYGEKINWGTPTDERYYYAIWALDYAMQMKITPFSERTDKTAKQQLAESLALVANWFNANNYQNGTTLSETDKATYDEAMAIYNSVYSTEEQQVSAKAKVLALMKNNTTAITDVNANANANTLSNGKYFINGKLIISKNGKQYNAAGAAIK